MAFDIMVKCTEVSIHSEIKHVVFEPIDAEDSNVWGDIFSVNFVPEDDDYDTFEEDGEYRFHLVPSPK